MVDPLMSPIPTSKYEDLVQTLTSAMSLEMKHKVMKRAVLQCPAIPMDLLG